MAWSQSLDGGGGAPGVKHFGHSFETDMVGTKERRLCREDYLFKERGVYTFFWYAFLILYSITQEALPSPSRFPVRTQSALGCYQLGSNPGPFSQNFCGAVQHQHQHLRHRSIQVQTVDPVAYITLVNNFEPESAHSRSNLHSRFKTFVEATTLHSTVYTSSHH